MQTLEPPMLVLGKGDAVCQLSTASLRFWEKLGLSPRAGPKNVTTFVFFEGSDEEREIEVEAWLGRVSAAYSVCRASFQFTAPSLSPHRPKTMVLMMLVCPAIAPSKASYQRALTLFGKPSVSFTPCHSSAGR